ncbi:tRNA (guanine-N(7)-)-methyltransferase non-catalytic subunit wuho [Armigeres subalbatus]|uniref:tRNA (guanine-N(7)-)-methyltransferase non-catalytic subunit wuho n=1 Tax=Armigeres subalbatus TaxID=124917 RepID=UPI002ED34847
MSFIKLFKNFVITGFNTKLLFFDGTSSWSYEILPDLPLEKCRPKKYFDADSDSDDESGQQPQKQLPANGNNTADKTQIVALEVHEEQYLLAVACSDKTLYLFEIGMNDGDGTTKGTLKLLSRRMVSRTSSCLKFAAGGKFLVVCDKGGDCYRYECDEDNSKKPGRWLLGHMSQVLDVLVSSDESMIITSDRDEKIRVTNHPNCDTIETFCLGHREFVSQLEFVQTKDAQPALLSLSGDRTLRLWDYTTGKELARKDLPQPGSRIAIKQLKEGGVLVAVLFYEPTEIDVFKIIDVEALKSDSFQTLKTEPNEVFSSLAFDAHNNLLALVVDKRTEKISLKFYQFENENSKFSEQSSNSLVKSFSANTMTDKIPYVDSVMFLFKKKIDNMKDYKERKRRRIEEDGK